MTYRLSAMDTGFYHSLGSYEFDVKCEMLAELGYGGIYLTLWTEMAWRDVRRLADVRRRHGIDATGVYIAINGPHDRASLDRFSQLVRTIEGCTHIELAVLSSGGSPIGNSDPAGDDAVATAIEPVLDMAHERGITIALYPHVFCWLERTEDGVRLCDKLDHPALGVVFSGWHWYVAEGTNLDLRIQQSAPHLRSLNICGSRRSAGDTVSATIEPLDEGELDNFALLASVARAGYGGPVLLQHYSVGGDVYGKFRRSLAAFDDMTRRLREQPKWGILRDDPLPPPSGANRPESQSSTLRYG